jgi:dipeptidyl aminopeptidase/acylaminoacyl peptidase
MHRLPRFLLALVTVGFITSLAAAVEPRVWTPDALMALQQVSDVQISPDGKRLAYTVRQAVMAGKKSEYLSHIHLSDSDSSAALPLTRGEKSCDHPRWSPDGKTIAFLSTRGAKRNIWLIHPTGGEASQLTENKTNITSFRWSPDGKNLAFTAADAPTPEEEKAGQEKNDARVIGENIKHIRLHVVAVDLLKEAKQESRLLTRGDFSIGRGYDWSPDGKTIVFAHTRTPAVDDWPTSHLSLVVVATGTVTPLVRSKAALITPLYSPDGKWIAYVASDEPATWGGCGRVHVTTATGEGQPQVLGETPDGWSRYSDLLGWSADGKRLLLAEQYHTRTRLYSLPLDGTPETLTGPKGVANHGIALNATRTHLGFTWETFTQPPEAHISTIERFQPTRVSQVNKALPDLPLGRTEVIRWKSEDGQEIEGLLTYPVGYQKDKRYPLLLVIHGGPMGVFGESYLGTPGPYPVAAFASRGYAVLRCNIRGSSGYGKKFRYANYCDWGGKDYKDLMTGVDHVIQMGVADADRLGVMGWSYGGFMTSWVITQTRRFKAASVGAGVTNLMSFTGTADIPGFLPDYFQGEPWTNFEAYRAHSAMFHVKGVTTPTLIQHGERDERVPLSQGQELYNALKRQKCTVKMVVYPRMAHGIVEPKLLKDSMVRNLEWFDRYVKGQ